MGMPGGGIAYLHRTPMALDDSSKKDLLEAMLTGDLHPIFQSIALF